MTTPTAATRERVREVQELRRSNADLDLLEGNNPNDAHRERHNR